VTNGRPPGPWWVTALSMAVALSVRQPWAELLLAGVKDVENRAWPTTYRGPLIVHAGQRIDREALEMLVAEGVRLPAELATGALLGSVEVVDCVRGHWSRWAVPGGWQWVVARPVRFRRPIPFPGRLKLFGVPTAVLAGSTVSPLP
jgi:hypothetical protein